MRSYGLRTTRRETSPAAAPMPLLHASKSAGTDTDESPERGELAGLFRLTMCCARRLLRAVEPLLNGSVAASSTPGRVETPEHVRLRLLLAVLLLRQNHRPPWWSVRRSGRVPI